MRLLVKVGGEQLQEAEARRQLALSVAAARQQEGHQIILVHGGGNQLRQLSRRLGIQDRYHQGLRLTDARTAELALMVLGGQVNRWLVQALEAVGTKAVGLTGADGSTFSARKYQPEGIDLGYVGEVHETDGTLLGCLLAADFVPVLATVAPLAAGQLGEGQLGEGQAGEAGPFYNINADQCAGPLAAAFAADVLLFLTDVPGVLDPGQRVLPEMDAELFSRLMEDSRLAGGMIPKVKAALAAAATLRVKIASASGENAILGALEAGSGTSFHPEGIRGRAHG